MITPGGNTSSYPPHKHDTDNLPHESLLEETYYTIIASIASAGHRASGAVYTGLICSLDEALPIEDGDVTLVPQAATARSPRCTPVILYYLNTMAGPKRTWKFHGKAEHEWLMIRPYRTRGPAHLPLAGRGSE